MTRIAVIADPHFHDTRLKPGGTDLNGAFRSYDDTASSTRVFNESAPAFRAALDRVVAEGIELVIIVGDLTDDGQVPNILGAMALLDEYRAAHGLQYYATLGNHDLFALAGRPQTKEFLRPDGTRVTVTSDPETARRTGALLSSEMATTGTLSALNLMAPLGFVPRPGELYWETPFGPGADFSDRTYVARSADGSATCRMIDASYLAEPVEGLWLMAIDANICAPKNGAIDFDAVESYFDPTDGGWGALLDQRAYLLDWMTDVAARAKAQGKHLLAFSHYPALDPLAGCSAIETTIFGATGLARRAPGPEVAEAFAATGVPIHLSGHLHVNDTAIHRDSAGGFVNIAVPSPVGFPPAFKILETGANSLTVRTLSLNDVPDHDIAYAFYLAEAAHLGTDSPTAAQSPDHGTFIDRHLADLVVQRYTAREWPEDMAGFAADRTVSDLADLLGLRGIGLADLPLKTLRADWYRLRKGADAAFRYIPRDRMATYDRLLSALPEAAPETSLGQTWLIFLQIMQAYRRRPPAGDFTVSLDDLTVGYLDD